MSPLPRWGNFNSFRCSVQCHNATLEIYPWWMVITRSHWTLLTVSTRQFSWGLQKPLRDFFDHEVCWGCALGPNWGLSAGVPWHPPRRQGKVIPRISFIRPRQSSLRWIQCTNYVKEPQNSCCVVFAPSPSTAKTLISTVMNYCVYCMKYSVRAHKKITHRYSATVSHAYTHWYVM